MLVGAHRPGAGAPAELAPVTSIWSGNCRPERKFRDQNDEQ
jgi:hypothetical protein